MADKPGSKGSENSGQSIIHAAGGLVWRESNRGREVALVHRPKYDDWTLPKGKLKKGETWQQGALREVEEEIQGRVRLSDFAGCCCYTFAGIPKVVLFWHMQLIEECIFNPNSEIDQLAWLSPEIALSRLDYSCEKGLVEKELIEDHTPE
jgi:8-oxo-dGTP diphosphatase